MRIIVFLSLLCLFNQPAFTQKEMQAQMLKVVNELRNQITDLEKQIAEVKKNKEDELKKFTDELEKTTKEELLDSPAVVLGIYFSDIVFETNPEKGFMLVTENPDYIRKDLPKYVPQVFVLSWSSWWDRSIPEKNIAKVFEQNFPIEKIQAMIDK